jgi:hypothetical protein
LTDAAKFLETIQPGRFKKSSVLQLYFSVGPLQKCPAIDRQNASLLKKTPYANPQSFIRSVWIEFFRVLQLSHLNFPNWVFVMGRTRRRDLQLEMALLVDCVFNFPLIFLVRFAVLTRILCC